MASKALGLALALLTVACGRPAAAQSLEETVLPLLRSGAESTFKWKGAGIVVDGANWEVKVVDPVNCTVRVTYLDWKPYTEIRSGWGEDGPVIRSENLNAQYRELYLNRVIPSEIKKVPKVLGTNRGVVVDQIVDGQWNLPGNHGDEVWCQFWPKGNKTCWDKIDVDRVAVRGLSDERERMMRVDRALTHLYGDLCKGSNKKVPF